jgi:hypothetical protein
MNRRQLLQGLLCSGVVAIGGCSTDTDTRTGASPSEDGESAKNHADLKIQNNTDDKRIVSVDIYDEDNEFIDNIEATVEAGESFRTATNIAESGQYTLQVASGGREDRYTASVGKYHVKNSRAIVVNIGTEQTRVIVLD